MLLTEMAVLFQIVPSATTLVTTQHHDIIPGKALSFVIEMHRIQPTHWANPCASRDNSRLNILEQK